MKMTSLKTLAATAFAGAVALYPAISSAASIATRWNPVSDGSIITSPGNNDRSDWDGLVAYPTDSNEGLTPDIHTITIAHDSTTLYLRQVMNSSAGSGGQFLSGNQYVMFDTDQNRGTGYRGAGDTFAVGAEYMLQGASIFQYAGDGTSWVWNSIGAAPYDDWPTNDHEMSVALSDLGITGDPLFDFVSLHNSVDSDGETIIADALFGGGDAYPNGGQGGASGDYFTYAIPEPSTAALLGLLGLVVGRRQRR